MFSRALVTIAVLWVAVVLTLLLPTNSREQTKKKFHNSAQLVFPKACGDGLDQDSACGACVRAGIALTKYASCGHVCLKLPDGLTPKDVSLVPYGAEGENGSGSVKCGAPYAPCVGWDRYEGDEWYADTRMICGRFKNWSNDRARTYSIQVSEK